MRLSETAKFSFIFLLFLQFNNTSLATASESFRVGLGGNNQVFTDPNQALAGGSFQLQVRGGTPATIRLDLVDIYADESGVKQPLPIDSNPFTPVGLVDFQEVVGRYIPTGNFQTIDIAFRFKNIDQIDRPILGGLRISIVPDDKTKTAIAVVSSIVATFAYYPLGSTDQLGSAISPRLSVTGPSFTQLVKDMVPFRLIPNIPRFYNQSPLSAQFVVKNAGNIFLTTQTKLVVVDPQVFGPGSDKELFSYVSDSTMLVPNQISNLTVNLNTKSSDGAQSIDIFPKIGIYKAISSTTGSLAGKELTVTEKTSWIIIFPWKYLLVGLILLWFLFGRFGIKARVKRLRSKSTFHNSYESFNEVANFNREFENIMAKHKISEEDLK